MEEGLLFEPSQWRGNVGQFLLNANAVEGAPKQGPIPSWNENVIDMVADPPTVQVSLTLNFSILLSSYVMWSCALDSSDVLLSYSITSLA
tara:strand:+ start:82 stop:351 length:270 start_codon:yes stop_codon:yes gene_type:complete